MTMTKARNMHDRAQNVIYTAWNLWKERCRRVFDNKALMETQLQELIKEDVAQWDIAWRQSEPEM
jgi:hypothetical protein